MKHIGLVWLMLAVCGGVVAQTDAGHAVGATPLVRSWQTFTDPNEGAFQVTVPTGWKVMGGTRRRNALQFRAWATTVSPDGGTILSMGDPDEPSYATPMYGFAPGSVYAGGGGMQYIVEPLQSAQQYAVTWGSRKLNSLCSSMQVTGSRPRRDLLQQVSAFSRSQGIEHDYGEATFTCEKGGVALSGYVLLGVTLIRTSPQTGLWYAESITDFLAPAKLSGVAAGLLGQMVKSFQPNLQWLARQSQTAVDVSHIATQTNAAISDMIMKGYQERGAVMDRVMEEGSRVRLGIDVYKSPSTGTQYVVDNTQNYYWVNAKGNVMGTGTDTAPGAGFSKMTRVPPQ